MLHDVSISQRNFGLSLDRCKELWNSTIPSNRNNKAIRIKKSLSADEFSSLDQGSVNLLNLKCMVNRSTNGRVVSR